MSDKNPRNPDNSPIRVVSAGGWDPSIYKNYVSDTPKPQRGLRAHVYGRPGQSTTEVYSSPEEYTKSKTESAQIDAALEREINKDLSQRNIKINKQTDN